MKKLFYTLIAAFLTASFLTGTTAAAPEDEALSAAEQAADSEEKSDAPIMVGMPNPMIEYPDVPTLERAIGFPILYLPSNFYALYHPAVHVFGISGQVADLRFKGKADDTAITLRTALKERVLTTDISGVHGAAWQTQSAGDVKRTQVDVAVLENGTRVVRWSAGRFVFALSAEGFDEASFKPLLKSFVVVADRFAHKYRNFTLNLPKK